MGFIRGEAREQVSLFPATLDELIPEDHACRVIEAFMNRLEMARLGFVRSEPAETGRPGYDPRDLLKLYLYGYMQQVRSSRRLEAECTRNVEVMWLLGRLRPDYKSIAEFRRMHLARHRPAPSIPKLRRLAKVFRRLHRKTCSEERRTNPMSPSSPHRSAARTDELTPNRDSVRRQALVAAAIL